MPILDRIRRIARVNIPQLLNQAEAPEAEIKEIIRELEDGAVEAKNALANFAVTYKRMEKNIQDLQKALQEHQRRAEASLEAGDEASAKRSLADKLKSRDRLEQLTPVLESRRETYDELKDALVEIHDQLNQARARLADLRSRRLAAEAERVLERSLEKEWEREEEWLEPETGTEGTVGGAHEPSGSEADSRREQAIEEELLALKEKVG